MPKSLITEEQKTRYLEELEKTGRVISSGRAAGLSYLQIERLRREDAEFDAAEQTARKAHGELWEAECRRRGIDGWDEPVFNKMGEEVGVKRRFSDRMLELGLKRHCPEYREKVQVDATISGGVLVVGAQMTRDEWLEKYGEERSGGEGDA